MIYIITLRAGSQKKGTFSDVYVPGVMRPKCLKKQGLDVMMQNFKAKRLITENVEDRTMLNSVSRKRDSEPKSGFMPG